MSDRDVVLDPRELNMSAASVLLAKDITDKLERSMPGWLWGINVDEQGGVVNILSMRLSGQMGYTLKTMRLQNDPTRKAAVMAAGELLERFGQKPGPFEPDRFSAAEARAYFQNPDVSDKSRREQRDFRTRSIKAGVANGRVRIINDADIAKARRELQQGR